MTSTCWYWWRRLISIVIDKPTSTMGWVRSFVVMWLKTRKAEVSRPLCVCDLNVRSLKVRHAKFWLLTRGKDDLTAGEFSSGKQSGGIARSSVESKAVKSNCFWWDESSGGNDFDVVRTTVYSRDNVLCSNWAIQRCDVQHRLMVVRKAQSLGRKPYVCGTVPTRNH